MINIKVKRSWLLMGAVVVLLGSQITDALAEGTTLEEITVTARKREENLLAVPVAVTAFSAESIAEKGLKSLNDIADYTPNFTISNTAGSRTDRSFANLIIRGMLPSGTNKTTSIFIDGAPVNSSFIEGIDDLERVEVIKGPQSAYFGRATFAGAVNFVTKTPGNKFAGRIEGLYGNNQWSDVRATFEGPLIEDRLTVRVSGRLYQRDGQYRNNGGPDATLGSQSTKSAMGSLYWTPFDKFSAKLTGIAWRDSDGPPATGKFGTSDYNCDPKRDGVLSFICGTLPNFPESRLAQNGVVDPVIQTLLANSTGTLNPISVNPPIDHYGLERRAWHGNLVMNYELPGSGIVLTSVTASNSDRVYVLNDVDIQNTFGIPNALYGVVPDVQPYVNWTLLAQRAELSWSQELRMTSDSSGRFRWSLGGSFLHERTQFGVTAAVPFGLLTFNNGEPTDTDTSGVFGSAAYDISSKWTLNVEGRYQADKVSLYKRPIAAPESIAVQSTFKNFLPRVILEYKATDRALLYASYSEGVNPGHFNNFLLTAAPIQAQAVAALGTGLVVNPEKLKNYEVGLKSRFWDDRVQLTTSVYYAKWIDQIISNTAVVPAVNAAGAPTGNNTVIIVDGNFGRTDFKGVEAESTIAVTDHLTANASFGFNDTKLKNYICLTCAATAGNFTNVIGNQLPQTSKWTGAAGFQYTTPLRTDLNWYFRGDATFRSGQYESELNLAKSQDMYRANFRTGIQNGTYTLEAFVLNAFDDKAFTSIENNVDVLNFANRTVNVGMPLERQFGVRGTYAF